MANENESQSRSRTHDRPTSQIQSYSYTRHHYAGEDLFWPEPLDGPQSPTPLPFKGSPPRPPREYVVKRRPVAPVIPHSRPAAIDTDLNPILSPIIPSPLRIRRPKDPSPQPSMRSVRLLVASLGNPPPYHSTRHSAGHIILKHLASHLSLPSFTKSKLFGSGLASSGEDVGRSEYTLWQSASLMNTSGSGTLKAWKAFTNLHRTSDDIVTALVILHDELESSSGTIKLRRGDVSPKGHNGIKSVQASLKSAGLLSNLGERFIKIGVGIGRPVSREKDDVSAWVLGQLTAPEKANIEAATENLGAVLAGEISRLESS